MKYHCPFCDYESDSRGSVEGHISGKSDSSHKGRVGRSHRSDIIQDAEPTSMKERLGTITGDSPASTQSTQEEIHQLRADLAELEEQLSGRLNNLERRVNAQPSTDRLRDEAVEAAKGELRTVETKKEAALREFEKATNRIRSEIQSEIATIESEKEEVLDEFESATDDLHDRLMRESKRAAKDEVSEQNEAITESLRQMSVMLSTLPTSTKVQCPKCGSYVQFKKGHKVTSSKGTNLTCPDCTTELINELPPTIDEQNEYI